MSHHSERNCCEPETLFEFVDGALGPRQRREVMDHISECPGCRRHCERELVLTEHLASEGYGFEAPSVCREVVMALPTRSVKMRFMWAILAAGFLLSAGLALSLDGNSPLVMAFGPLEMLWSSASGFADVATMFASLTGTIIVAALIAGAVFDLLIAGVVFSALRRRTSQIKRA